MQSCRGCAVTGKQKDAPKPDSYSHEAAAPMGCFSCPLCSHPPSYEAEHLCFPLTAAQVQVFSPFLGPCCPVHLCCRTCLYFCLTICISITPLRGEYKGMLPDARAVFGDERCFLSVPDTSSRARGCKCAHLPCRCCGDKVCVLVMPSPPVCSTEHDPEHILH